MVPLPESKNHKRQLLLIAERRSRIALRESRSEVRHRDVGPRRLLKLDVGACPGPRSYWRRGAVDRKDVLQTVRQSLEYL